MDPLQRVHAHLPHQTALETLRQRVFLWDISITCWCKGTVLHTQTALETRRHLATARDMHAHVYARPVACGRWWFQKVVIRLRPARA